MTLDELRQMTDTELNKLLAEKRKELNMVKGFIQRKQRKENPPEKKNNVGAKAKRTAHAMSRAKKRANHCCENPGCKSHSVKPEFVIGSHIKPRKTSNPHFKADDYHDIIVLCFECDRDYSSKTSDIARVLWLRDKKFFKQADKLEKTSIKI